MTYVYLPLGSDEMEPCPFCGNSKCVNIGIDHDGWSVECMTCHSIGPTKGSEMSAVDAWNGRASVQSPQEMIAANCLAG